METDLARCIQCGKQAPEHTARFAAVNASSVSQTAYSGRKRITTTTTTESFAGADRCAACEACVRKNRRLHAVGGGLLGMFGGFFGLVVLAAAVCGSAYFNEHAKGILLTGLAVSLALGTALIVKELREPAPFVLARLLRKARGPAAAGKTYVPVDRTLYFPKDGAAPDLGVFKSRTGLKTGVGELVFMQFILTGMGDALADGLLEQQAARAAEEGGAGA